MKPLAVFNLLAAAGLGVALFQAAQPAPVRPSATPTPCVVNRMDLEHLEATSTLDCAAADATATAYIMVTVTPCAPWGDENTTPIPGSMMRFSAPCAVVAHDATWGAIDATETAGIIDGSNYGYRISNGVPLWTPTILVYGTVPPEILAAYPATWTARPQETPMGWHLEGDRWVADGGRRP